MIPQAEPPNPESVGWRAGSNRRWSLLPVPALMILMVVLYFTVAPTVFYDPPWLIVIGNTAFIGIIGFLVAGIAWRNYLFTGRLQMLLLGCGVLLLAIGGVLAAVVRGLHGGANLNVTIYNTGALLGAMFHFVAALILLAGFAPEAGARRRNLWLGLGYGGSVLFMAVLTLASLEGLIPPFFVQGLGPTMLRQQVLGAAGLLFVFSCLVFFGTYYRNREGFLYWYAGALALTAISLTGFFIQHSVGSPVGWVGRFSQYLGGLYFLVALRIAARSAESRGTSFDDVLEASLTGAEERFRSAFASAAIGFAMATPDGRFVDANPAHCAILGYSVEELRRLDIPYLIHPDDRDANMRQIERMLAGHMPGFTIENRYVRKGGEPVWVRKSVSLVRDAQGSPRWIVALVEHITERKRAEEALRESEERFALSMEATNDGLWDWNAETDEVYYSPSYYRILGFEPGAFPGTLQAWKELVHPEDLERTVQVNMDCVEGRSESFAVEYRMKACDGQWRWVLGRGKCITRDAHGRAIRLIGTHVDITERKRTEELLIRSEKVAALGRMAASLAHDINNPLSAVMNTLFLARSNPECAECAHSVRPYLEVADEELRRVSHITQQALAFYREGSTPTKVAIRTVLDETVDIFRSKIKSKNARVEKQYQGEIVEVVGIGGELRQMFSNLVANSLDAIGQNGIIKLRVRASRNGRVRITIADDGRGIEPRAMPRIFEPLYTTKGSLGTGLGLWVTKQLIDKHNGSIHVRSSVNGRHRGTTFTVVLPTATAVRAQAASVSA